MNDCLPKLFLLLLRLLVTGGVLAWLLLRPLATGGVLAWLLRLCGVPVSVCLTTCNVYKSETIDDGFRRKFVGCGSSVVGFGVFRLEGRRFESHSSRYVRTSGKYFTHSCP